MDLLATNLRARAHELGLSDAEVARRAGLGARRYGFYATGDREPDFQTFVSICHALDTTPNTLLGFDGEGADSRKRRKLEQKLTATGKLLSDQGLRLAADHADLILRYEAE